MFKKMQMAVFIFSFSLFQASNVDNLTDSYFAHSIQIFFKDLLKNLKEMWFYLKLDFFGILFLSWMHLSHFCYSIKTNWFQAASFG